MNASLKQYALTVLGLGLSAINSFAAESLVYRFKDGTVTVAPRESATAEVPNKLEELLLFKVTIYRLLFNSVAKT